MASTDDYLRSFTDAGNLLMDGRAADALALLRDAAARHPERRHTLRSVEAAVLAIVGDADGAAALMRAAVDDGGWWWSRQRRDEDVAALRAHPAFAALDAVMQERERRAVALAAGRTADVRLLRPGGPPRAALVVLHMHAVTAAETAEAWAPVAADGVLVAVAESTVRDADGLPCWEDDELTRRDVGRALARVDAEAPDAPLVLAGGSQGAATALRLTLDGSVPRARGFLAVVGAGAADRLAPHLPDAAARGVRGVLVAGERDRLTLAGQREVAGLLDHGGVPCRLVVVPDLPHVYPPDLRGVAADALEFLLGG